MNLLAQAQHSRMSVTDTLGASSYLDTRRGLQREVRGKDAVVRELDSTVSTQRGHLGSLLELVSMLHDRSRDDRSTIHGMQLTTNAQTDELQAEVTQLTAALAQCDLYATSVQQVCPLSAAVTALSLSAKRLGPTPTAGQAGILSFSGATSEMLLCLLHDTFTVLSGVFCAFSKACNCQGVARWSC